MSRKDKSQTRTFNPSKSVSVSTSCEGKTKYLTEDEVKFEADIKNISYYKCQWCNGYHLTSKEK